VIDRNAQSVYDSMLSGDEMGQPDRNLFRSASVRLSPVRATL
jgi:hypothetical protein